MCISAEHQFVAKRRRDRASMAASSKAGSGPEQVLVSAKKDELLEACLRYDWDQVNHLCRTFSSVLIRKKDSEHTDLVRQQLIYQDAWGNTALHAACHYDPPCVILKQILKLAKATGVCHSLCTLPNANGAIPLVVCCTTGGASLTCLLLLLEEVDSKEQLCDSEGNSAIDGLLKRYLMLRKLPKFAKQMKPLQEINSVHSAGNSNSSVMIEMDDLTVAGFDKCWTKMELIMKAAWVLDFQSLEDWSPLHGAANMASQIPPELSELLVRCHANMVSTLVGGALPLHLAIGQRANGSTHHQDSCTASFVQHLIHADSSTVSHVNPKTGQLPLMRAIEAGFSWQCTADTATNDGILKQLWAAYPEALEEQDSQSGLYPALLAATTTTTTTKSDDNHADQVENIFSMLRLNPSIVAGG
ncbi:unnamed protein product [Cylindrotheca closterium]|uniref:Uncharacterized protein n=1 Tax=Cylindrotheca closterium TaxID=2856 RepID=A0AAD2GBE4_9STRA|nr:unnamed protein product [Cylindrotheca closterium]